MRRFISAFAVGLLLYGTALIFLQTEVILKLLRGLMGYAGLVWGGFSDLPTAWAGPTDLDTPLRDVYSALTLRLPVLPWGAWVAGALLLLVLGRGRNEVGARSPEGGANAGGGEDATNSAPTADSHAALSANAGRIDKRMGLALGLLGLLCAFGLASWLRVEHLLPSGGEWGGSNFDEMVYYTQARLFTQGAWAYRDTFMAHPPGVLWALSPALMFEKAWGGAGAFIAARQWLLLYSLAAVPLVWLCGRKLGGTATGIVAALILAFDGKAAFAPESDRLLPNVGVLETLANVAALGALAVFLYAPEESGRRKWALFAAGALAGVSAMCKLPGVAIVFALLVYPLAVRRGKEALWVVVGVAAGMGALSLPLFVAAPGQMIREVVFFQLLRPQEVRAGIDQASRIASYPEAQVTLLLAGLGILAICWVLMRWRRDGGEEKARWALPVLWAAPLAAVFLLGRSYHSQYYTQWVPPLALIAGAAVSRQVWGQVSAERLAPVAALGVVMLPTVISQWRVDSYVAYDSVYRLTGAALQQSVEPGGWQAMAFDPGYTFAAALPPARIPYEGDYIVDTAGYTVYTAEDLDRRPWGDLIGSAFQLRRERNEADVLQRPEAQGMLLAGAVGANAVVLDQKIALPKLTAQSARLLEAFAEGKEDIGFARLLRTRTPNKNALGAVNMTLVAAYVGRLGEEGGPIVGKGNVEASTKDAVQIGLYWLPDKYPSGSYHVVVRLVDAQGNTVRQADTEPSEGKDHTAGWRPGFVYPDLRNIPLDGLAPGTYGVSVRVYDSATQAASQDVALEPGIVIK